MKINVNVKLQVLDTVINDLGDNKIYYNLTVYDPTSHEAGTLKASKDVFDSVLLGKVNNFVCEYNDKYNSFRAVKVADLKEGK